MLPGLTSSSVLMKIEVLELLSVVCMYSDEGHKLVIEALAHYKVSLANLLGECSA